MIRVVQASPTWLERWDQGIERSVNGTLFHLRRFLAHHGARVAASERFLLVLDGDSLLAQLPAAIVATETGSELRSPYGAGYGGLALQRYPTFAEAERIVDALLHYAASQDVRRVTLTPPLAACAAQPLDVVAFALLRAGFTSVTRDVSSLIALAEPVSSRARDAARRAQRRGVSVSVRAGLEDFWSVVDDTFERNGATPTHTLEQFTALARTLPERVYCDVAYNERRPVAGIGYFVINDRVTSSFYLCQRTDSRELDGLTLCIVEALARARGEGYAWFDVGTSSAAMVAGEDSFGFEERLRPVGQFRETFRWTAPEAAA